MTGEPSATADLVRGPGPMTTRERILLEASRLFARLGYHAASTREIARRVGVRQPSLFHHFASKQAIMDELLTLNFDRAVLVAEEVQGWPGRAAARLIVILRADLRFVSSVPYDLSGTHGDDVLSDPAFRPWSERQAALHEVWRALVAEATGAGDFVPYDPALVGLTIEGAFKEVLRVVAGHHGRTAVALDPDDVVRFLIRGLLVRVDDLDALAGEADLLERRSSAQVLEG